MQLQVNLVIWAGCRSMSLPQAFPAEEVTLSMMIIILIMMIGVMIIMLILMVSMIFIMFILMNSIHDHYVDLDDQNQADEDQYQRPRGRAWYFKICESWFQKAMKAVWFQKKNILGSDSIWRCA